MKIHNSILKYMFTYIYLVILTLNIHISRFFPINPHKIKISFQNFKCKTLPRK